VPSVAGVYAGDLSYVPDNMILYMNLNLMVPSLRSVPWSAQADVCTDVCSQNQICSVEAREKRMIQPFAQLIHIIQSSNRR
jgi:hypothetical protein